MYFTVKTPIRIGGKLFKTCVCYEVTPYLELTVQKLAKEGKVDLHEKFVYFCNGKPVEQKAKTFEAVEKPAKKAKAKKTEKAEIKEEPKEETVKEEPAVEYETEEGAEDF